jgi:alpha-1,2-mannosyltransferase|nr:DUF2029 domain-containing protein [Propionibacterium sp.]
MGEIGGRSTRLLAAGLIALAIGTALVLVYVLANTGAAGILGDLAIYRGAIRHALAGGDLYDWAYSHPTVHGLGFTYPPFAALVLLPAALLDSRVAEVLWTASTFGALLFCLFFLVQRSPRSPSGRLPRDRTVQWAWVTGLALPAMVSAPFLHNLVVGQVSVFLVALVLLDLALPKRWQGALVGLAAAIKLTPLVFLPFFLVTGQWRRAANLGGVFLAAAALALVILPQASVTYWTDKLWRTERVGRLDSTVNKSLLGFLSRELPVGVPLMFAWVLVGIAVTLVAFWSAARYTAKGGELPATLILGVLSVALSPISWPHHMLWLVIAACWCFVGVRSRIGAILGAVLFVALLATPWYGDHAAGSLEPALRVGSELPALAPLLVLGWGLLPGLRLSSARGAGRGGADDD